MVRMTFQAYPHSVSKTFDCPSCGKKNRKRTFKAECTVNPFNKGEDGIPLDHHQVREQSKQQAVREADEFMRSPLCSTCENGLGYTERKALVHARKAGA